LIGVLYGLNSSKIMDKETRYAATHMYSQVVTAPLLLLAVIGGIVGLIIKFVA